LNRNAIILALLTACLGTAAVIPANASNYRALLPKLKPGDTLSLSAGKYARLPITGINGTESAWITIKGPDAAPHAVIVGTTGYNTVEIFNSSYVTIENLRIDSLGIPGAFGISARGKEENLTHHIRIQRNTLVGQGGGQQTVGISTKTPTWGWIIRYNQILGAGTGIYLGDSDGTQPFVNGLIEHNLIRDTIGYNMEIKDQLFLPDLPGLPTGPTSTIIRHNVFIKNDQPNQDGDRPNVLISGFPATGPGSLNTYEIYGNLFYHNPREALFQGSGRFTLHDNIFVDGPYNYPAVVVRKHTSPIKLALVYNNTIYTLGKGIYFGARAETYDAVIGNLVFSSTPISGPITRQSDNIVDYTARAATYVKSPSLDLGTMNWFPLPGKCQGEAIDLSDLHTDTDYSVDFNGTPKMRAKGAVVYRGAYAGEGSNPGWALEAALKYPIPPMPNASTITWITPANGQVGSKTDVTLTGSNFTDEAALSATGSGIEISNVKVAGPTKITATLKINPGATAGPQGITVTTRAGKSNPATFRVIQRRR
jgi:hypothetical protein